MWSLWKGNNMTTNLFLELHSEKKRKIVDACISEFAKYGYYNSSTNRIVKNCGISKGSLFKYFPSKEELYFYILDNITTELMTSLEKKIDTLPKELFKIAIKYSELEFAWYMEHPKKYKMILNAFTKSDTEIYHKTEERYRLNEEDTYYKLLQNVDTVQLKWDKEKTIDILKWFLKGFNEDFISRLQVNNNVEIESIRNEYVKSLTEYMEILKEGLVK